MAHEAMQAGANVARVSLRRVDMALKALRGRLQDRKSGLAQQVSDSEDSSAHPLGPQKPSHGKILLPGVGAPVLPQQQHHLHQPWVLHPAQPSGLTQAFAGHSSTVRAPVSMAVQPCLSRVQTFRGPRPAVSSAVAAPRIMLSWSGQT